MARNFAKWEHEDPEVYWVMGFVFIKIHIKFWYEQIKTLHDNGI